MSDDATKKDTFSIKLTGPGLSVEQDLDRETALKIVNLVMGGTVFPTTQEKPNGSTVQPPQTGGAVSAKQFMVSRKPSTDAEKMACLAYFLHHHRDTPQFKTKDLTKTNTEAQQNDFSNPTVASNNAMRDGLFSKAGKGNKQITTKGEAIVEALPDREKVKELMKSGKKARRLKKKAKS